jgi:hypothetical protein
MAHKHEFVEDYIEIIAGYREPNGKSNYSIFTVGEPIISLARYDMKIVPSLAQQSAGGQGYTDKQAALARDLVLKYERQLSKHGVDVAPVRTPQYRYPIRKIDRTSRLWIESDTIKLKFPYNVEQINQVRDASKISNGEVRFNHKQRCHDIALTEWNLNWFYSFAQANHFEIDPTVADLMKIVLAAEQRTYSIELQYSDNRVWLTNGADSLHEYVAQHLGGWTPDNILRLIDWAPILGYTVSPDIAATVIQEFGNRFWSLCANRQLKVDTATSHNLVRDIVAYAQATNRFPIFVFEPDMSARLLNEFKQILPGGVVELPARDTEPIDYTAQVLYTTRIPRRRVDRIPLMISSAGMLHGGDRHVWIQTAEKVVYFSKDVYNKNTKGPEVCKLD